MPNTRQSLFAAAVVAAFAVTPAQAQTLTDSQIVAIYDQVNTFDIEAALLGEARAQSPDIRALARMVASDHLGVRRAANAISRSAGIALELPIARTGAAIEHDEVMANLGVKSGAEFDRAYLVQELAFHRAAYEAVRTELLPQARNPQLQAHFREVLPHFAHHIAEMEKLAGRFGVQ